MRLVIVGGVAGGATLAARAMRLNRNIQCTLLERSPDVSFANCGLPYHIGGEIPARAALALQTPQSLKTALGISRVEVNCAVTAIDTAKKEVHAKHLLKAADEVIPYDKLVLAPGARPIVPPLPGINNPRVLTLRNLKDMDVIIGQLGDRGCKKVTVVGAGFIGVEMVEQLHHKGKTITLVERSSAVIPQADPEIARFLHPEMVGKGVRLMTNESLAAIEEKCGQVEVVLESGKRIPSDLVILSIGVRPESDLAAAAGLELSTRGQIVVNDFMQTSDPSTYAVGDVVETRDMVFPDRRAWVALGNVANMQARIAADHLVLGSSIPYPGSLGTAIVRCFNQTLAITGWSERRLQQEGIPYKTVTINANDHAGYYPGASVITLKVMWDPATGRLLGAQAAGTKGVDKRIDVLATAIQGKMTIDDISETQLTYSPPFGSARDVVNVAGISARNVHDGLCTSRPDIGKGRTLLDVRPPEAIAADRIGGAKEVFWTDVDKALAAGSIDPKGKYSVMCNWGRTAYFACRTLKQAGVDVERIDGGRRVHLNQDPPKDGGPTSSKL